MKKLYIYFHEGKWKVNDQSPGKFFGDVPTYKEVTGTEIGNPEFLSFLSEISIDLFDSKTDRNKVHEVEGCVMEIKNLCCATKSKEIPHSHFCGICKDHKQLAIISRAPVEEKKDPFVEALISAQIGSRSDSSFVENHMKTYFNNWKSYENKLTSLEWYHLFLECVEQYDSSKDARIKELEEQVEQLTEQLKHEQI